MSDRNSWRKESLETLVLRGDLNFEQTVMTQINRCLGTAVDSVLYSINVDLLRRMLPKSLKDSKGFKDNLSKLTVTKKEYKYKYCCGYPMGTPDKPIYSNLKSDWNYKGGDPVLVSPILEDVKYTDWKGIFELCLDEFDKLGVSWSKHKKGGTT